MVGGEDELPIGGHVLPLNDDAVSCMNTCTEHAVAFDPHRKADTASEPVCWNRNMLLDLLFDHERTASSYPPDDRNSRDCEPVSKKPDSTVPWPGQLDVALARERL